MRVGKALFILYFSLFYYLFVLQGMAAWPFTIDDAYISVRYAKHLSLGQGLVWNINEPVIEGYSNFLYVIFAALFLKLKIAPITALKIISYSGLLLSAIGVYFISRLWLIPSLALLAPMLLLFYPGEILWGVSALETTFFQALIIFSVYFLLLSISQKNTFYRRYSIASGLLLTLASLTRVEGPMLYLCSITGLLLGTWLEKNRKPTLMKSMYYLSISFLFTYMPYFCWHYMYFGKWFANPVYCKALNAQGSPLKLDTMYLILVYPIITVAIPYLKKQLNSCHLLLLLPSLFYLITLINADWIVGFLNRHFLTAFSLLCPILIISLHHLFSLKKLMLTKKQIYLCVLISSLAAGIGLFKQQFYLPQYKKFALDSYNGNLFRTQVSHWLNKHLKIGENIALGDCGIIPYYFKGNVVDTYCLNSLAMQKKHIHFDYKRYSQWLIENKKPDYIALIQEITKNRIYMPPTDYLLYQNPQFKKQYQKVKVIALGEINQSYQYLIYKKSSSTHPLEISAPH